MNILEYKEGLVEELKKRGIYIDIETQALRKDTALWFALLMSVCKPDKCEKVYIDSINLIFDMDLSTKYDDKSAIHIIITEGYNKPIGKRDNIASTFVTERTKVPCDICTTENVVIICAGFEVFADNMVLFGSTIPRLFKDYYSKERKDKVFSFMKNVMSDKDSTELILKASGLDFQKMKYEMQITQLRQSFGFMHNQRIESSDRQLTGSKENLTIY